jgi:hypothetical protein
MFENFSLKPDSKLSVKKKDSVAVSKSFSNYYRYAYRPKISIGVTDKNLDSFDTYSSIYQITDRSCQTSLDLLEPFVERALKKRNIKETSSLVDEKELIKEENKDALDLTKTASDRNLKIEAFGNLFAQKPSSITNKNLSPLNQISLKVLSDDKKTSTNTIDKKFIEDEEKNKIGELSAFTKRSKSSIFTRSLKYLNNSKKAINRNFSAREMKIRETEIILNGDIKTDPPVLDFNNNNKNIDNNNKKSLHFSIDEHIELSESENPNIDEAKAEQADTEQSSSPTKHQKASNSSNFRRMSKSLSLNQKLFKNQVDTIEMDSPTSTTNQIENESDRSINLTDIENEYLDKMNKEDGSLEDFKQVFIRNQNLIVNWDYVQSSDYL